MASFSEYLLVEIRNHAFAFAKQERETLGPLEDLATAIRFVRARGAERDVVDRLEAQVRCTVLVDVVNGLSADVLARETPLTERVIRTWFRTDIYRNDRVMMSLQTALQAVTEAARWELDFPLQDHEARLLSQTLARIEDQICWCYGSSRQCHLVGRQTLSITRDMDPFGRLQHRRWDEDLN